MSNANGPRTSHISDAADLLGVGIRQGAGGFFYLGDPDATAIGRAFTVRQVLAETLQSGAKPEARHGEAADRLASPGEILVIAIDGATEAATWGEAHTLRSIRRGLAGVLIDGATRDFAALGRRRFPVLCRASSPVRSSGRLHTVAMNTGDRRRFDQCRGPHRDRWRWLRVSASRIRTGRACGGGKDSIARRDPRS